MSHTTVQDALDFAQDNNIVCIPIRYKDKVSLVPWKKYQSCKPTKDEMDEWFGGAIKRNIAYLCGSASGVEGWSLIVIDIDNMGLFHALYPEEPKTRAVQTSKGAHLYFFMPGKMNKFRLEIEMPDGSIAGIDVQAEGSYIVAPGSIHPLGALYQWLNDLPIAKLEGETSEHFKESLYSKVDIVCKQNNLELKGNVPEHDIEQYLDGVKQGSRNRAGYLFASFCRRSGRDKESALKELMDWNSKNDPPLLDSEVQTIVASAYKDDAKIGFKFKDLVDKTNPYLRYMPDGKKVRVDILTDDILEEYHFVTVEDTDEILWYENGLYRYRGETVIKKWCNKTFPEKLNRYWTGEVMHQVKCRTFLEREQINAREELMHLENGIFNLNEMTLEPFDPSIISTVKVPIVYDPEAECPQIEKFMSEILKEEDIPVVQEMFGFSLLRDYKFPKAFLMYGARDNGKSTLLELLRRFLGVRNTSHQALQHLVNRRFNASSLFGKLANICADLSSSALNNLEVFRQLTGRDMIDAEYKGKPFFSFKNYAKLVFSANQLPAMKEDLDANWKRIILIDFPRIIPKGKQDPDILDKLTTEPEMSGLFNWAIEGLSRLLKNRTFTRSPSIESIKEQYTLLSDPFKAFLDLHTIEDSESVIPKAQLYSEYAIFCHEHKIKPLANNVVGREIKRWRPRVTRGRPTIKGERVEVWNGIAFVREISVKDVRDVKENPSLEAYYGEEVCDEE